MAVNAVGSQAGVYPHPFTVKPRHCEGIALLSRAYSTDTPLGFIIGFLAAANLQGQLLENFISICNR
jgi:hypothetical protein